MRQTKCGTYAGWYRHYRAGEKACDACRQAVAEHRRARRESKSAEGFTTHSYSSYCEGCRCDICRTAKSDYQRAYKRDRRTS